MAALVLGELEEVGSALVLKDVEDDLIVESQHNEWLADRVARIGELGAFEKMNLK